MGQALTKLSLQEFLDWENQQPERHEFHRGEVFAMVGARRVHGLIALNIAASLKAQLKGSQCRVFADSMQVKVGADTILYPDVAHWRDTRLAKIACGRCMNSRAWFNPRGVKPEMSNFSVPHRGEPLHQRRQPTPALRG